jgi:type III secretion protein Q
MISDSASTVDLLAQRLPKVAPAQARLQRLGFDARFGSWLATRFGAEDLRITPNTGKHAPGSTAITLQQPDGAEMTLLADLSPWPAAQLLLHCENSSLACELANALFHPGFEALSDVAPGLKVTALQTQAQAQSTSSRAGSRQKDPLALPTIQISGITTTLREMDHTLLEKVLESVHEQAPPGSILSPLRICGRLRLAGRSHPLSTLSTLAAGDVLLLGAIVQPGQPVPCVLHYGKGTTMQANTEMDLMEQQVQVTDEPELGPEDEIQATSADAHPLPDTMSDLMLPVSFEIDTAAISLGELASIQPGYVVELAVPLLEATVRLVCHGQTLGTGQLVAIGEQLGVRINRMATQHDIAAHR